MATLVKEKRRKEKKKSKDKHGLKLDADNELETEELIVASEIKSDTETATFTVNVHDNMSLKQVIDTKTSTNVPHETELEAGSSNSSYNTNNQESKDKVNFSTDLAVKEVNTTIEYLSLQAVSSEESTYKELNRDLAKMKITNVIEKELKSQNYCGEKVSEIDHQNLPSTSISHENVLPSAPIFEEQVIPYIPEQETVTKTVKPKVLCMQIEKVMKKSEGGDINMLSEKEEAIVEAGPLSGPEHPLVDLLSTFRSSLISVERVRTELTRRFADEEKSRTYLWVVQTKHINITEPCSCGVNIYLQASYEHAELLKDKLPVARLKLESLLRDVQDSYCHHQHEALLAYCQIEDLISETIKSSKQEIREALSLVLQTLRMSDNAPTALGSALQRWACALTEALQDARDLRQLLFIIHHLFRQTRSVRWASRFVGLRVDDVIAAKQVIGLLDVLLARQKPRVDTALECTEDTEEAWEEVDRHGTSGAISEGSLRERDLLALYYAFPLRDTVARLLLFTHADIRKARSHEWVSRQYAYNTLEACCGVRVLLYTLQRAVRVHAQYARLNAALRKLATNALVALAALHLHSRPYYIDEQEDSVTANLEAAFAEALDLFGTEELYFLPSTLLGSSAALEYCNTLIDTLHDKPPIRIESMSVEIPTLPCNMRVRIVSQAAVDRHYDHKLAEIVLAFLFQCGIKRISTVCPDKCDVTARYWLPQVLSVHSYLYPMALHMIADLNSLEPIDPSALKTLSISSWRPNVGELRSVLDDWERRCLKLMQYLLLEIEYTPHTGISYECQLTIGSWLSSWACTRVPPSGEWWWQVLRRLRVHRLYWGPPIDALPPESEPVDLFAKAYALCSTSWGHSIPMICTEGVSALCTLACTRARDAVHCAAPIMALMSHSPESVSLTPKFTELFATLLSCRPSLMQRALGRGAESGADLLLKLILDQLHAEHWFWVERGALLRVWLHALWNPVLPGHSRNILDTVAAASRCWPVIDAHVVNLLQREKSKEYVSDVMNNAATAPLLCECVLRGVHAHALSTHAYASLLRTLYNQRVKSRRIHVDNALQQIGGKLSSEDLVIYLSAKAAMVAPLHHPSQLMLWRFFMHLYLERPDNVQDSIAAIGPLFYSGIIKTRTLGQVKKCLQDTVIYHHNEVQALKAEQQPTLSNPTRTEKRARTDEDILFPTLSMVDFMGESSGSDSESDATDEEDEQKMKRDKITENSSGMKKTERSNLIRYHEGAEKMICEYLRWLEEGDKVRALPHQADIHRFISEQALDAGWQELVSHTQPHLDLDSPTSVTPATVLLTPESTPSTPFNVAVKAILKIKDRSCRRPLRTVFKSPLENFDARDTKSFLALVDKHLQDIKILAKEWCTEVNRVSTLDSKLWEFVCALRVRRPLPSVQKQCSNKCKFINIVIPAEEWCISTGAEQGVRNNRHSARLAIRRLSRARPHAARSAATLHSLLRRINSTHTGLCVLKQAWRTSSEDACAVCPPASSALTSFTELVSQRWICHDGRVCAQLVSQWGRQTMNSLQQAQCSALVSPRRLPTHDWPVLYTTLLQADLPHNLLFSCLSKFEMSRWSENADTNSRQELLKSLLKTLQRWGPVPESSHHVLVELAGVHSRALLDVREICQYVVQATHASVACTIPPSHWTHVVQALNRCAYSLSFEQLGQLLREVGVMWWEARTGLKGVKSVIEYAAYASYYARVLHVLVRAFVAAAMKLSYTPERVGKCAWSGVQECWGAWVSPHPAAPPLLPSTGDGEAYTPLLQQFVRTILQIINDCTGSGATVLRLVWEWTIQCYLSVHTSGSQESRVQMSALLAELSHLPWETYQWCTGNSLQIALQTSTINDKELTTWCCRVWRRIKAETWIREEDESETTDRLALRLASLLYLFSGTTLLHVTETYEEATKLPWWWLPGSALDEALERFFAVHHNPAQPYHTIPQFNVIMHASGLRMRVEAVCQYARCVETRVKRVRSVSQWVRCACAPVLASHASAHCTVLLNALTQLAPYLDNSDEIEELLSRAVVIMCIEPAAAAALPIWMRWVRDTNVRMIRACVTAASGLTTLEYFAQLGDAAIKAFIDHKEGGNWEEVRGRWRACPWQESGPLVVRKRLYAAYGLTLAYGHSHEQMRNVLHALAAADLHFKENDAIIAVWICVCMRACVRADTGACAAARALVHAWATPPARSLLRVVSLQPQLPSPTVRHRLLCRLALWTLDPSESNAREYETACAGIQGSGNRSDLITLSGSPDPKQLPQLAMRLYPLQEKYFTIELNMASSY